MAIKLGILALFTLLFVVSVSTGFEWIDEDAIYIEDGAVTKPVTTLPRAGDPNATTLPVEPPPPPVTAIPVEIIPGLCVKASECYPILFYSADLSDSEPERPNALLVKTDNASEGESSSTTTTVTTPESTSNAVVEEVKCGPVKAGVHEDDDAKYRVVGGQDAELGQFPWMVALTNKGRTFCSGSLLDERHVLLAAHCVSQ
ncbi:Coagulation factor IX [Folsomia candida]|uniref:Coagulation factor IX n=1 Tax=Folsomia candida TaxID=158441 RepID=A0A226DCK6_FOLCA|nr:Coagulation factor IX [Folsomia candida]